MPTGRIVLGSRGSALALCQARLVEAQLKARFPNQPFAIEAITAEADQKPDQPLPAIAGEGIFVKALEVALQQGRIDLAIHSMKDLPLALSAGLVVASVLKRDDARDALVIRKTEDERPERSRGTLVTRQAAGVDALSAKARVGTSSLRRRSQLLHRRGDLDVRDIRGNVDTRLRKLDEGQYDAILVAACGLIRLGLADRITEYLDMGWMLPEPGQGALAVEARKDDPKTAGFTRVLDDAESRACISAERAFLDFLGGGCRVPIAAFASCQRGQLILEGAVIAADGHRQIRGGAEGPVAEAVAIGQKLGVDLASQGAADLLKDLRP